MYQVHSYLGLHHLHTQAYDSAIPEYNASLQILSELAPAGTHALDVHVSLAVAYLRHVENGVDAAHDVLECASSHCDAASQIAEQLRVAPVGSHLSCDESEGAATVAHRGSHGLTVQDYVTRIDSARSQIKKLRNRNPDRRIPGIFD